MFIVTFSDIAINKNKFLSLIIDSDKNKQPRGYFDLCNLLFLSFAFTIVNINELHEFQKTSKQHR